MLEIKNLSVNYVDLQRHLAKRDDRGGDMVKRNETTFESRTAPAVCVRNPGPSGKKVAIEVDEDGKLIELEEDSPDLTQSTFVSGALAKGCLAAY